MWRMHTRLVLVLYVVACDDAVSIEPLDPAQVHAPVFHFSHFQFRRIWRFCAIDGEDTRLTHQTVIFRCCGVICTHHPESLLSIHMWNTINVKYTLYSELNESSTLSV